MVMFLEINFLFVLIIGVDVVDEAIVKGIDLDGFFILLLKFEFYYKVMVLEG